VDARRRGSAGNGRNTDANPAISLERILGSIRLEWNPRVRVHSGYAAAVFARGFFPPLGPGFPVVFVSRESPSFPEPDVPPP